jgi:crotonobetainyl-CoA:carnitine CoA-transferase CaiB-like acyl-CoA transferase
MKKPLNGIKVVDLTLFAAGPGAGRMLADWGADVIKVESLKGDPMRTFGTTMNCPDSPDENPCWEIDNANKKSIALDLKTPEGAKIMDELLARADVFITSNRTDALIRLGLDYETMSKKHPHIVWGQINGWGDRGPLAANPGFDSVAFWARGGCMIDGTEKDTVPMVTPIGFGDSITSCSLAAGVCAALVEKMRTGKGSKVNVSLYGQAIWCGSYMIGSTQYGRDVYPKSRLTDVSPLVNSYKGSDGEWFFITILEHERYWSVLCDKVLQRPDLINDSRFATAKAAAQHRPELIKILDEEFEKHTCQECCELLKSADIAYSKVNHFVDVHKDEQALANNYVYEVQHRNGHKSFVANVPVQFDECTAPVHNLAPLLGENTVEILKSLGHSDDEIGKLLKDKTVMAV